MKGLKYNGKHSRKRDSDDFKDSNIRGWKVHISLHKGAERDGREKRTLHHALPDEKSGELLRRRFYKRTHPESYERTGIEVLLSSESFSKVTATRLSTRGLLVDTDNLEFLENEIFEQVNTEDTEVIIAWGNSHLTSKAVNTAKKRILEIWTKTHPAVTLKQIVADGLPKEISGVHPLYMGIRHSNAKWKLGTFPTKKELKILAERERGGKKNNGVHINRRMVFA